MDSGLLAYLWMRLPLVLLFVGGYLVYRLLAVTRLTDVFARAAVRGSGGSVPRLLAVLMLTAAGFSLFIPNAITMLTLLPVLKRIDARCRALDPPLVLTTPLALAVIYGANIGGVGSLIGSPANLLLVGALDWLKVPGRESISFLSWFLWALPLAMGMLAAAWGLLVGFGASRVVRAYRLDVAVLTATVGGRGELSFQQRSAVKLFGLFLIFWTAEAVAKILFPGFVRTESVWALGFFAWFAFLCFFRTGASSRGAGAPLLTFRDVFGGLPLRGLALVAVIAAVLAGVHALGLDQWAAGVLAGISGWAEGRLALYFTVTVCVILLTEGFSNTVVAAAFFPVAYSAATAAGLPPLGLMVAVSVASTCAFMTPVATPCNALAFGEMRGISLGRMMLLGVVLNFVCAAMIACWLPPALSFLAQ